MERTIQELNGVYKPIYEYLQKLLKALTQQDYSTEWGFYNNHSVKQDNEWCLEYYPIPVITVKDICDIGIDINHVFIECKIRRENTIEFDWNMLSEYDFEVFGVEDYLKDFYNSAMKLDEISERISLSNEHEIGIGFKFCYLDIIDNLLELIKRLKTIGAYIL